MKRPPVWCALQIILVALDAGRELFRVLARVVASLLDVALVEPSQVDLQPGLHLRPCRTLGMVGKELACALDLLGERNRRKRLGADEILDEFAFLGRASLEKLAFKRMGQRERVSAAWCFGIFAKELVDPRQRGGGVVSGCERKRLRLHGLPALGMPDLVLRGLDLMDRRRKPRRLVLELTEAGVQVGRRGSVGDPNAGGLDLPLGLLQPGLAAERRPEQGERWVPLQELGPPLGDGRRGAVFGALKGRRAMEGKQIGTGERAQAHEAGGRESRLRRHRPVRSSFVSFARNS